MKPVFSGLILAVTFGGFAGSAYAEEVCMPQNEMKSALIDWYGEQPVPGQGKDNSQLWASEQAGTWTLVKTMADGNACVMAQGQDWMKGLSGNKQLAALLD